MHLRGILRGNPHMESSEKIYIFIPRKGPHQVLIGCNADNPNSLPTITMYYAAGVLFDCRKKVNKKPNSTHTLSKFT